jgi:hypothetical protein
MTHAEPRQDDLGTQQSDGLNAEGPDGLNAEQPDGRGAEQSGELITERPAASGAEQSGDLITERSGASGAEQSGDLSTEQIARAGATTAAPAETTEQALARSPQGDEKHRVALLEPNELEGMVDRWRDIQASFVDAPREAVKDADALVAELMQELARTFASQREQLESSWSAGDSVSTEDLRQGLQRYRSFFERLLAA